MDSLFVSADMAAESFSPAHCRHFKTIKHFDGIPWRRNSWGERDSGDVDDGKAKQ